MFAEFGVLPQIYSRSSIFWNFTYASFDTKLTSSINLKTTPFCFLIVSLGIIVFR